MSMTICRAAAWFDDRAVYTPDPVAKEMCKIAAAAIREKAESEYPIPLSFEELLQMDGELVWLKIIDANDLTVPNRSAWAEICIPEWKQAVWLWLFGNECELEPNPKNYSKTWVCYYHKPKEERQE